MKTIFTLLFALAFAVSTAQNCNCDSIFYSVKNTVEKNYAGYFDKVNSKNKKEYEEWTTNSIQKITTIKSDSLCYVETKKWLTFYKDKHLQLKFSSFKKTNQTTIESSKKIEILKLNISEVDFENYLKSDSKKDKIESIWENSNYKLAIKKVQPNLFYATVLQTQNQNWNVGEVKLIIQKNGLNYTGTFFEGDKTNTSEHSVKLIDNILDFDIVFFERKNPSSKVVRNLVEYEIQQDKQAPKLSFKKDLAIFSFPNFYGDSFEQLQFLLKQNQEKLKKTPYWIIDLRDNDGGNVAVGKLLLPYIYTKPIISYNAKMRITESNIKIWFDSYLKEYYDNQNEETKKTIDAKFKNLLTNHLNELYDDKPISNTIVLDSKTDFPKKIALLINKETVSSGELFTLLARQSDKVTVYGENSAGMMDYGNLVRYNTPSSLINLNLPIYRQNWLDEGYSVDKEGIKPEVYIKLSDKNLINNLYNKLKTQNHD